MLLSCRCYIFTGITSLSSSSSSSCGALEAAYSVCSYSCSLKSVSPHIPLSSVIRFQEPSTEPLESQSWKPNPKGGIGLNQNREERGKIGRNEKDHDGGDEISGVRVPRQKYIPVSKAELLDAIMVMLFDSQGDTDAHQFLLLSSYLDSILHVEHKGILEEMRMDYTLTQSMEKEGPKDEVSTGSERILVDNGYESDSVGDTNSETGSLKRYGDDKEIEIEETMPFNYGVELRNFFDSLAKNVKRDSKEKSRVAVASRFQRAFMQLLYDAQFEELSARDLMLTSALNTDYLLTLPIYVDWKKASESNAIIFRRGYATDRQKGLLIVEKLDYIQSKVLQGIFFIISKPLGKVGTWINEALINFYQTQEVLDWSKRMNLWFKELSLLQQSYDEESSDTMLGADQSSNELPIWLAAQRAVSRYEGLLSSIGPRGRLFSKLLTWTGLMSPTPEIPFELENDSNSSEPYSRPIFLSRISLSDIWRPASKKSCGNDLWKMIKTSVSILLSRSILQEPAFEELILLYTREEGERKTEEKSEVPSLQLKIYERIPIPDLPVIFPHKKLSFRIIDTVRLDIASILGLLAYFINYKFEDIVSSPSAIFLDAVAISALIIFVIRVALGYKQTWDRYQLLVNKTLYEKTLASGFGSVHFLLDASEQQQYKEAILAYAILLHAKKGQVICCQSVGDESERFMYDKFRKKVKMPVDKAVNTLLRLGLAIEMPIEGRIILQATPCQEAHKVLKDRWNSLLS